MNLRPNPRRPPDIVLIPLLDVLLVLLIFFMVSTTFKDETRMRVQLPKAAGEEAPTQEPQRILIQIDRSGDFYVDDRPVTGSGREELIGAIRLALGDRESPPLIIQADAQTPHQAVMTAMDAAAAVGLVRIAFAAIRPDAGTGRPAGVPDTSPRP